MLYRRFGKTELKMPVFSCGGMRYQDSWQDKPMKDIPDEGQKNLEATINRAVELGINHIETARGYGSSERQLGQILPKFPRDKMIIQTKVSPKEDSKEFRKEFEDSLARLNLDYVDLLSLHGVNNQTTLDWSVNPDGCLKVARELVEEGLVRHVGFSTHGSPNLVLKAVQSEEHGGFDYVNLHWYYIYQWNWPAIEAAKARDMGVFIISPSDKGGRLYAPTVKIANCCGPLHPMAFNDLWCLSRDEVSTLSLGAARPSDFDIHVEALKFWEQRDEILPSIEARLEGAMMDAMKQAYGDDYSAHFTEGLPEWEDAPDGLNIKLILWLYSIAKAYDFGEYASWRYNMLGTADHWFAGQNLAKWSGGSLEKALAKSPYKDKIPTVLQEAHSMFWSAPRKRLSEGG